MSWMGNKNAAKREAQRAQDTADIVAEGWAPPLTAHDARMATGEDGCNSPDHDHSRELTDAEVDAALRAPPNKARQADLAFTDDGLPETACRCGLPACRSGWPQVAIDALEADHGAEADREA
jgi:hypothetical protein